MYHARAIDMISIATTENLRDTNLIGSPERRYDLRQHVPCR